MQQNVTQKNRALSILTGILILAIGVILIICNKLITGRGVVVVAGILFLITGIINVVMYVTRRDDNGRHINRGLSLFMGWLVSVGAMILGICMLVFISTFIVMVPFIFGLLIFFGAVMLAFTYVFNVRKVLRVPGWLWFGPVIMVILGIITITRKADVSDPLIMILTGVSMIIFGLSGLILSAIVKSVVKSQKEHVLSNDTPAIEQHSETDD